jgi:hypothetical protein
LAAAFAALASARAAFAAAASALACAAAAAAAAFASSAAASSASSGLLLGGHARGLLVDRVLRGLRGGFLGVDHRLRRGLFGGLDVGHGLRGDRGGERVQHRRADVAGDGHAAAGALDELAGQRRRGRLAVGAGDREDLRRVAALGLQLRERLREQVQLAAHRHVGGARGLQQRREARVARAQARALVDAGDAVQRFGRQLAREERAARDLGGQRRGLRRVGVARVPHANARALARAPARHGQARGAQPQDQHVLVGQIAHFSALVSTQLQARQADQAQQHRDDPEADHDLRLGPAGLLEMVVQRRHLQDAPALAVLALRVLEVATWAITDSASATNTPPMIPSTISWRVITAIVPSAPPSDSAPTSPMNTCAGCALNHRNARPAPAIAEQKISSSPAPGMYGNSRYFE